MSVRLLQLSDPHFGTERPEVVASLLRCVRAIGPDLVVLSGDITQRATRAQFAAAAAFVAALAPLPVRVVPGNHDIPLFALATRLLWPYRRFAAAFGVTEPAPWERDGVAVLFMDSTSRWRHRHGVLAPARARARLAAAAAARLRVVVLHHPATCRRESDEENIVRPGARWSQRSTTIAATAPDDRVTRLKLLGASARVRCDTQVPATASTGERTSPG